MRALHCGARMQRISGLFRGQRSPVLCSAAVTWRGCCDRSATASSALEGFGYEPLY